jgi:hypothetical protein
LYGKTGKEMIEFVEKYSKNIFSQNGEDGIIEECLKRMKIEIGSCCEFGAADGYFCSNTRALIEKGWRFTMLEAENGQFVTPENVNELVPDCDVLSIDIDGNDYAVWKAYDKKPKIVIIEINSSLDPQKDFFTPEQGTNFSLMLKLGHSKGYFLLCHTGNMVFIKDEYLDLFDELDGHYDFEFFNKAWLVA